MQRSLFSTERLFLLMIGWFTWPSCDAALAKRLQITAFFWRTVRNWCGRIVSQKSWFSIPKLALRRMAG